MTGLLPLFARHETFHPRVGWLTKAVDATRQNPHVFTDERASVDLGVGKNMVRAIRYWGLATKVLAEARDLGPTRATPLVPSVIGQLLLGQAGLDRYIEDPRTLWLLHWYLLRPPMLAPVWWWFFEEYEALEFEASDVERFIADCVKDSGWESPASSSIAKDVDCLIRMYGRRSGAGEWLDSPFASLGLLEPVPGTSRRWRFTSTGRHSLEPEIVAFACLDAIASWEPSARSVSLGRLASAEGGPGRAFRITEAAIADALRYVARRNPALTMASPAGLDQLIVGEDPSVVAKSVLAAAYGRSIDDDRLGDLSRAGLPPDEERYVA